MKNNLTRLLISSIFCLALYSSASACSCPNPPTVEQSFEASNAVIYGVVTYAQEFEDQILAVVEVKKSWKGVTKDRIIVKTGRTSCDISFSMDQAYYLWLDGAGDRYETSPCRRHAVTEETYLAEKPLITLESIPLDPDIDTKPTVSDSPPAANQSKREKEAVKNFSFREISLVMITAVVTTILVLLICGGALFLWQRRNR